MGVTRPNGQAGSGFGLQLILGGRPGIIFERITSESQLIGFAQHRPTRDTGDGEPSPDVVLDPIGQFRERPPVYPIRMPPRPSSLLAIMPKMRRCDDVSVYTPKVELDQPPAFDAIAECMALTIS